MKNTGQKKLNIYFEYLIKNNNNKFFTLIHLINLKKYFNGGVMYIFCESIRSQFFNFVNSVVIVELL
jgi:hypothetical protein